MGMAKLKPIGWVMLAAAFTGGCATLPAPGMRPLEQDEGIAQRRNRTAWVVDGSQMLAGRSVLEGLRSRFPTMQVRSNGSCPDIIIRGRGSIQSSNAPRVYVDGQRAADSCILSVMRAGDVRLVEIYPAGHTGRAGYLSDPNGLILIFTRNAFSSD